MKCIKCDKDAVWIRNTQFAGDHPYCKEHAKQEDDFGENDSYAFWSKVKKQQKDKSVKASLGYARIGLENV